MVSSGVRGRARRGDGVIQDAGARVTRY